jgi:hypothetical protein
LGRLGPSVDEAVRFGAAWGCAAAPAAVGRPATKPHAEPLHCAFAFGATAGAEDSPTGAAGAAGGLGLGSGWDGGCS